MLETSGTVLEPLASRFPMAEESLTNDKYVISDDRHPPMVNAIESLAQRVWVFKPEIHECLHLDLHAVHNG